MATIRPMTAGDVDRAAQVILAADWGDRTAFFRFASGHPRSHPVVAVDDGEIVGTGVGTASGVVGWIGAIFVAPSHRRRGLGIALTEAVIDALTGVGVRTLVLVATTQGRPLYEGLGFSIQTEYRTLEAPGTGSGDVDPRVRPFRDTDLPAVARLDRAATGEDREHLLAAFASAESARVVTRPDATDAVTGFLVRAPWGGGATIAPAADDAVRLLESRRASAGPDRRIRAGVLAENVDGAARLAALGWTDAWRAPRLVRGDPIDWRPGAIWGQFNHALG